jgi:hypothetical protein
MKRKLFLMSILIGILLPAAVHGQLYLANEALLNSDRSALESSLKFNMVPGDSFEFSYEKSPGKAFLLSAILPGAGELYAGAKWRALAFSSVEIFSWIMYFHSKNTGNDLESDYKKYADLHWDLINWLDLSPTNDKCGPELTHHLYITYKKGDSEQEFVIDKDFYGVYDSLKNDGGVIEPVKTRDYYENIGKYGQFACGWDDYLETHTIDGVTVSDTIFVSPDRNHYLHQRKDSNDALKMATNFATVIMFNHLFSAFHAQIAAKQYSSEPKQEVSWYLGLLTDIRYKNPIRGISLSLAF